MTPIFIDIEILKHDPDPWLLKGADEISVPRNYKKPETIAKYRAEKLDNQVTELRNASSLMPNGPLIGGTVCAFAVTVGAGPVKTFVAPSGDEAGELELLSALQGAFAARDRSQFRLVTFNGTDFDLPFLAKRALRHGLHVLSRWCYVAKPWDEGHVDLLRIWRMGDRMARGKLTELAAWLGIEVTDTTRGSDIQAMWEAGGADAVGSHASSDVALTREIYWRFRAAGWVSGTDVVPETVSRALDVAPFETHTDQGEDDAAPDPGRADVPQRAAADATLDDVACRGGP